MTPEERVAPIWERWVNQETIGRSQIEAAIRAAENDVLERAAALIGRKSLAGVISMSDAMVACRCLKSEPVE
jgi:hypothetical protein